MRPRRRHPAEVALAALLLAATLHAHHILGVPHYAYDESYPQAPVITYAIRAGAYTVNVTGYPGRPAPFELAQVHAYVRRTDDAADVYDGPVSVRLERDGFLGPEVVWGPQETRFEENLHEASPQFGKAGNYRLRLEMQLEGQPYELDFPLVAGEPTSATAVLALFGGGIVLLLVVVRAARIKLERRRRREEAA